MPDWVSALEKADEGSIKRLVNLWSAANRIRVVLDQKQNQYSESEKQELEVELKAVATKIKLKVELLLKFKPPRLMNTCKKKKCELRKMTAYEVAQLASHTEMAFYRLKSWQDIQLSSLSKQLHPSLFTLIVEILQNDITAAQLIEYIEHYYSKAIVFSKVIILLQQVMHLIPSRKIRKNTLSWIMLMFDHSNANLWHYSNIVNACGSNLEAVVRSSFFSIIRQALSYISTAHNPEELCCLMEALQWNYSVNDHKALYESQLITSICAKQVEVYNGCLYGKPLKLLLDTFRFVVMKVVVDASQTEKAVTNNINTENLLNTITMTILAELKQAADSYEALHNPEILEEYVVLIEGDTLNTEMKDETSKRMIEYKRYNLYSPEICDHLLGLLCNIYTLVPAKSSDFTLLFRLLENGTTQHQFLVLRLLPLIAKTCYKELSIAIDNVLTKPVIHTKSSLLDLLISFIVTRREGLWNANAKTSKRSYSITKYAISVIRLLFELNENIRDALTRVSQSMLFGNLESRSVEWENKQLVETILAIIGGEFISLYKGAKITNDYLIVGFRQVGKNVEYEFDPLLHDKVIALLISNKSEHSKFDASEIAVSEVIPPQEHINLKQLFEGIKTKQVKELLIKAVTGPLPKNGLLATIQMQVIKISMEYFNQCKDYNENTFTTEFIKSLLEICTKKTIADSSRSLATTEIKTDEIRKLASQKLDEALVTSETNDLLVRFKKHELILNIHSVEVVLNLVAHKGYKKLRKQSIKGVLYKKGMSTAEIAGKVVFVPKSENDQIPELAKCVQGLIVDTSLNDYKEVNIPMFQIDSMFFSRLDVYMDMIDISNKSIRNNDSKSLLSEYAKFEFEEKLEVNSMQSVSDILTSEKADKKTEDTKLGIKDQLESLANYDQVCANMLNTNKDSYITNERNLLQSTFSSVYKQLYNKINLPISQMYCNLISDLKLLYVRKLLLDILASNKADIKEINFIPYLLIMKMEADFLLYGCKYKSLSKEVNAVIKLVLAKDSNSFHQFTEWFHSVTKEIKAIKIITKYDNVKMKFFGSPSHKLIYIPFIYKCMSSLLKHQAKTFFRYKGLGEIMEKLAILMVTVSSYGDKLYCLLALSKILSKALSIKETLSLEECNNITINNCARAFLACYKKKRKGEGILTRLLQGIVVDIECLAQFAMKKFGEEAESSGIGDVSNVLLAIKVLEEFPKMTNLINYTWTTMFSKDITPKNVIQLKTPTPFYLTQYKVLIENPHAESFKFNVQTNIAGQFRAFSDKEGKMSLTTSNKVDTTELFETNRIYLVFPVSLFGVYGFGSNEGGRLGLGARKVVPAPEVIKNLSLDKVSSINSKGAATVIIDSSNTTFTSGDGVGRLEEGSNVFQEYSKQKLFKAIDMSEELTMFISNDENDIHFRGKDNNKLLPIVEFKDSEKRIKNNLKNVKEISISSKHVLICTKENELYASPESAMNLFGAWSLLVPFDGSDSLLNFPDIFGEFDDDVKSSSPGFYHVNLEKNYKQIKKVLAMVSGSVLLVVNSSTGKNELISYGVNGPELGQGDSPVSGKYAPLKCPSDVEFTYLAGHGRMAAAITNSGELYTWGKSSTFALGLYSEHGSAIKEANVPTKVAMPEAYKVLNVSVGSNHMLVLAEESKAKQRVVFGFGDNSNHQLGIDDVKATKSELKIFSDFYPYLVVAGSSCSFVACGNEANSTESLMPMCEVHKAFAKDRMYLVKTKDSIKIYCKDCVGALPEISIAIRNKVTDLELKPWPILEEIPSKKSNDELAVECNLCKRKLETGAIYLSAVKEVQECLCESCYFKTPTTLTLCIHYRVSSLQILLSKDLPIFSLADFYQTNDSYLYVEATPKCSLSACENVANKEVKLTFENFLEESESFTKEQDLAIIDLLNKYISKKGKGVHQLQDVETQLTFSTKDCFSKINKDALKRRINLLVNLQTITNDVAAFIEYNTKYFRNSSLYNYCKNIKEYLVTDIKTQRVKEIHKNAPQVQSYKTYELEPWKVDSILKARLINYSGQHSVCGQLWKCFKEEIIDGLEIKSNVPVDIRVRLSSYNNFKEVLEAVSNELRSSLLPYLKPSPNNVSSYGSHREAWVINPAASQKHHLEVFEFLGFLMGICMKIKQATFDLKLPPLFWKLLVGDPVTRDDLKAVDLLSVQCLNDLESIEKIGISKEMFEKTICYYFTTRLSDGTEVELKKDGKIIRVTLDNIKEYVKLVEQTRMNEGIKQINAIRKGLYRLVSKPIVELHLWQELRHSICADNNLSTAKLKQITTYKNCNENLDTIQYLWSILDKLVKHGRFFSYLRFLTGRSSVSFNASEFEHIVEIKDCSNPDKALPEAQRCYSMKDGKLTAKLILPKYSLLETTEKKLLAAINSCKLIDVDLNVPITWGE